VKSIPYDVYAARIEQINTIRKSGRVVQIIGLVIESAGPAGSIGDLCYIENPESGERIRAEIAGFRDNRILLMPLGTTTGITPGSIVISTGEQLRVPVGDQLIGRVLGGLGQPIDGLGPLLCSRSRTVDSAPIHALKRRRITEPVRTGIKAIDIMNACGKGQRMGIFAGSGVGKSVLLGMIARGSSADVNVIALVGERGREVREFIEKDLGPQGLKKSVVVAVTSDHPALIRIKGAHVATAIAEYFRDQGMDVVLLMDSLTRIAAAQREVGLAVGEPPATKGYTPSVFAMLPRLLERAGTNDKGSITGLYTVLVEGDDFNEPISDAVRAILDGHISLSRKMATFNLYPAVDSLDSISRLMVDVCTPEHLRLAARTREIVATYRDAEDLINVGAYVKGSSAKIDEAISKIDKINQFFRQDIKELCQFDQALEQLAAIVNSEQESSEGREKVPLQTSKNSAIKNS
jgi:flagellum-specific ATP synthase